MSSSVTSTATATATAAAAAAAAPNKNGESVTETDDSVRQASLKSSAVAQDFVQRLMSAKKSGASFSGAGNSAGGAGGGDVDSSAHLGSNAIAQEFVNRMLHARPTGVHTGGTTGTSDRDMVQKANIRGVIFPWMLSYKIWWYTTVAGALLTVFLCPILIGFQREPGGFSQAGGVIEAILMALFAIDIAVKFDTAFHHEGVLVYDRRKIVTNYLSFLFWVDLIGVIPFDTIALAGAGLLDQDTPKALLLSLLKLLTLVRLYRMKKFSNVLQFNARISLVTYTLARNFCVALAVTNFSGCIMYFIARVDGFGEDTWIGPIVQDLTGWQRYITSLYWSVVTFATVGYGDYHAVNSAEMVWGVIFMFFNMVVQSWFIGSITLLVVKGDEKTGEYRDSLATLEHYADMHQFDDDFRKKLRTQLRLEFHNREIADEQVLKNFPNATRRKVLRRLYLPFLSKTQLMKGVRQQFVDAFLSSCTVEIFTPGEEIVERGSIMSDLFLLVGGIAEITTRPVDGPGPTLVDDDPSYRSSVSTGSQTVALAYEQLEEGAFIGEIGFFTESPQVDSVRCVTVCKTLTLSKQSYRMISQDHPGSVGKILQNLLNEVERMKVVLPKSLSVLRAGSVFDMDNSRTYGSIDPAADERRVQEETRRKNRELTAIRDLVKMHMSKQKDDQTTRFLFAASRGDVDTISLMCDQGFDVNAADYDNRTALMVASMKASDAVKCLLEYGADPDITDVHGTTALHEAVKNGHEPTMDLLLSRGATLCMGESLAASVLCQAVFDGDILFLRRLLRAGINVNAADYDKRTAAHIAAAEGNVAALKTLVEFGADLTLEDRWQNTVDHEAVRSKAGQLIDFLRRHRESISEP